MDFKNAMEIWTDIMGHDLDSGNEESTGNYVCNFMLGDKIAGHFTTIAGCGFKWDYPQELIDFVELEENVDLKEDGGAWKRRVARREAQVAVVVEKM